MREGEGHSSGSVDEAIVKVVVAIGVLGVAAAIVIPHLVGPT